MTAQATSPSVSQALQADTGLSGATLTAAYAASTDITASNVAVTSTAASVVLLGAHDTLTDNTNLTVAALGASDTVVTTALKVNFIPMGANETLIDTSAGATIIVDPTQALARNLVAQIDASHDTIIFQDLAEVVGTCWTSFGWGQSCFVTPCAPTAALGYCPVTYCTPPATQTGYGTTCYTAQCSSPGTSPGTSSGSGCGTPSPTYDTGCGSYGYTSNYSCNTNTSSGCGGASLDNLAAVLVVGDQNLIKTGAVTSILGVVGHLNDITGGVCDTSVTLTGIAAAANVVMGGAGKMTLVSTAIVTKVIGGAGTMTATITGDAASVIGGAGCLNATVVGSGGDYQTGSGTARITVTGNGGVFATGSGASTITANGNGALVYEAVASGNATFNVNGTGMAVFGGDLVNANGNGNTVYTRGQIGGSYSPDYLRFLFTSAIGSFLPDPVIAAALAATGAAYLPDGVIANPVPAPANTGSGGGCGYQPPSCGGQSGGQSPSSTAPRTINFNGDGGSVYSGDQTTYVNLTGNNNSIYAGSIVQYVTIGSGSGNGVYAGLGGGNNVYDGGPGRNYLDYRASPTPVTVNLATGRAINALGGTDTIRNLAIVDAGAGSTLIAGAANATLTIHGDNGTLKGAAGNDILHGTGANDAFFTGAGTDTVKADGAGASYTVVSAAAGTTFIDQAALGITGTLSFAAVAQPTQLWLQQDAANDLVVTILGTAKTVTFAHWFATDGTGTQLARIGTTGAYLDNTGVNAVQQAMATYQSAHAGFNPMTASVLPADSGIQSAFSTYLHAA